MIEVASKKEAAPRAHGKAANTEKRNPQICNRTDGVSQPAPVSHEIVSCANALGVFGGQIKEDQWEVIQMIRRNLYSAAEYARALERSLEVPRG